MPRSASEQDRVGQGGGGSFGVSEQEPNQHCQKPQGTHRTSIRTHALQIVVYFFLKKSLFFHAKVVKTAASIASRGGGGFEVRDSCPDFRVKFMACPDFRDRF